MPSGGKPWEFPMHPAPWRSIHARVRALGDPSTDLTAQAQAQMNATVAQGQAQLAKLQGQGKATWDASQTPTANALRIANGAKAAESLLQNGYDPNNNADNQAAITAVAGGLSLIVPVGTILGGALMILDAIALGIAAGLEAIGLIPKPGCTSTGNFTPADALSVYPNMQLPAGSFGALAIAALATNTANALNCKAVYPGDWIVSAIVQLWNANSFGSPVQLWVPDLDPDSHQIFDRHAFGTGTYRSNAPPPEQLSQYAFQPLMNVPASFAAYGSMITVNGGPFLPVNWGTVVVKQPPFVPSTGAGKAATIVKGAAITAGVGAAGIGAYALATGQSFVSAASSIWSGTQSLFGGFSGALETPRRFLGEELGGNEEDASLAAEEARRGSMKVQSLLFRRPQWTPGRAKDWAASHHFKHAKIDVTENYVRIRQFSPAKSTVTRTRHFGNGISAVVAR